LADDLDAEEVDGRRGLAGGEQEQPLAEADLDLDGVVVAEDGPPVEDRGRAGRLQQPGGELLQGQATAGGHARVSRRAAAVALSSAAPGPRARVMATPRMSAWKTMVLPTKPWTLKTVWRRFMRVPLATITSRSPTRTWARKRTFSRPPKPMKS